MIFDRYILIVCILTALINFIGISSIAARIVGTRTGKLASSTSIFNLIIIISQFANTIQAPLLAKNIESSILLGNNPNMLIFRTILLSATLGSALGAISIPTVHRFMEKGVYSLYRNNSIFMVLVKSIKLSTIKQFKLSLTAPNKNNLLRLKHFNDMNISLILLNIIVYGFITTSVLSCLYAGHLNPTLRTTSLAMSGVANALGAIGLMLFIEPYNSILTDKVIDGTVSEAYFRRYLSFVVVARVMGTLLAQLLFVPIARIIIFLTSII